MKTQSIVKIGKYKGRSFSSVPVEYADWMRRQGNWKFYGEWIRSMRFVKHENFKRCESKDGRWMERKLKDGNFVFYVNRDGKATSGRIYYLVDPNGNYLYDLVTFGIPSVKQGAIDPNFSDWMTLMPDGRKVVGKMLVSPYYEHFAYETHQILRDKS